MHMINRPKMPQRHFPNGLPRCFARGFVWGSSFLHPATPQALIYKSKYVCSFFLVSRSVVMVIMCLVAKGEECVVLSFLHPSHGTSSNLRCKVFVLRREFGEVCLLLSLLSLLSYFLHVLHVLHFFTYSLLPLPFLYLHTLPSPSVFGCL